MTEVWSSLRFWCAACAGTGAAALALVTVVWRDWIEAFGVDLDRGDGALEWIAVGVLLGAAVYLLVGAQRIWVVRRGGGVRS